VELETVNIREPEDVNVVNVVLGVVDGGPPNGVETNDGVVGRKELLRRLGNKG
jgi:adenosine/AMP kinase